MAEERDPRKSLREIRKRLIEGMRVKVRYGRATLTVHRSVAVLGTSLGEALKAYQREEISAEDVAWCFLREQAITQSPTFDWKAVELTKLLPRVAAVVREPELKAGTPEELIAALERVEADEQAAKKRLREQIKKFAAPPDYLKIMQRSQADLQRLSQQTRMLQQHQETLRKMTEPLRLHETLVTRQREQLEQMQRALRPAFDLQSFGLTQSKVLKMLGLKLPSSATTAALAGIKNPFLEQDWRPVFERVAEVAREADSPEIAEAVEAVEVTATKVEEEGPEVDLDAMREAIEGLTEQLEESNRLAAEKAEKEQTAEEGGDKGKGNDSFSRQLLIQLTLMLIRWLFEAVLSAHLGIPLPPHLPKAPDQGPSDMPEPPDSLA